MTDIWRKADDLLETEIDDETVVMEMATGDFFSLKDTAREAWSLVDGTRDRAAIRGELARRYPTAGAELDRDLDAFFDSLKDAGLLIAR